MARFIGWCARTQGKTESASSPCLQARPPKTQGFPKKIALSLKGMRGLATPGQRVRYLCQDETRLGLNTLPGRLITARGVKPMGETQWRL